jgi:hypothetical protein
LQAKVAHDKDPNYFAEHSVLELNYAQLTSREARVLVHGEDRLVTEITSALDYQLKERLQFIKKNDPVVASLLFDYAKIEAATASLEYSNDLLELAGHFGYPADRISEMRGKHAQLIQQRKNGALGDALRNFIHTYWPVGFAMVALGILVTTRRWGRSSLPR